MMNTSGNMLYLDVETTGLNKRDNGIHQFSGLFEVDGEVVDQFDYYLKVPAYKEIEDEALKVSGVTRDDLKNPDRIDIADAYKDLKQRMEKYGEMFVYNSGRPDKRLVAVGYNIGFDLDFLKSWWTDLKRVSVVVGKEHPHSWLTYYYVDMYRVAAALRAMGFLDTPRLKLEVVAEGMGIPLKPHDSLEDAKATRTMYHMVKKAFDSSLFSQMIKEAQDESGQRKS